MGKEGSGVQSWKCRGEGSLKGRIQGERIQKAPRTRRLKIYTSLYDAATKAVADTSGPAECSKSRRGNPESENEAAKAEKIKSIRGAAARNHMNKEVRHREAHREKERLQEALRRYSNV